MKAFKWTVLYKSVKNCLCRLILLYTSNLYCDYNIDGAVKRRIIPKDVRSQQASLAPVGNTVSGNEDEAITSDGSLNWLLSIYDPTARVTRLFMT